MTIFEERGLFWWHEEPVPDGYFAPPTSVLGLLTIGDEGGAKLELDGFLTSANNPLSALMDDRGAEINDRCIEGILKGSSQRVLLTRLFKNGGRFASNGMSYEGYMALNCIVGQEPFPSTMESLSVRSLWLDLEGLGEWLRLGAISLQQSESTITAIYSKPEDASYSVDDGTISIKSRPDVQFPGYSRGSSLSLKEKPTLVYNLNAAEMLDAALVRFSEVEDFFILLTGSAYGMDWPWVSFSGKATYRWYFMRSKNKETATAPRYYECWTNFPSLRDTFGKLWSAWKTKRETFGPGFYLYFGTRRGVTLFPENRFMNLIWGIEALDRKNNAAAASDDYLEKIARIVEQVTDNRDKTWLQGKLRYAYEPNLEDRIFRSFEQLPLGLENKRLRRFAKSCADRRNEISHHGGHVKIAGESYGDFVIDIDQKSDALSTLYHALLLHEIGIDGSILKWWIYEGFRSYPIKVNFVRNGLLDESELPVK